MPVHMQAQDQTIKTERKGADELHYDGTEVLVEFREI